MENTAILEGCTEKEPLRLLGRRIDWMTLAFRVALDPEAIRYLEARARAAKCGEASVDLNGWRGTVRRQKDGQGFALTSPRERVIVWPNAPGGDAPTRAPGWTVKVEQSGIALLAQTEADAVRSAWTTAAAFGIPIESRRRRLDLAADFAGYAMHDRDVVSFVKRTRRNPHVRRAKNDNIAPAEAKAIAQALRDTAKALPKLAKKYAKNPQRFTDAIAASLAAGTRPAELEQKSNVHGFGLDVETIHIGAGAPISFRSYDKLRELAHPARYFKREAELTRWRSNGYEPGDRVTRCEFQITSEALRELHGGTEARSARDGAHLIDVDGDLLRTALESQKDEGDRTLEDDARDARAAELVHVERRELLRDRITRAAEACGDRDARMLGEALDPIWSYLTTRWLRLIDRSSATRRERARPDPRWAAVQGVTWELEDAKPARRFVQREDASAVQALGIMFAMQARAETLPELTDADGVIVGDEAHFARGLEDGAGVFVERTIGEVCDRAKAIMLRELLTGRDDRRAAEYLAGKWLANAARYARPVGVWPREATA